MKNFISLNIPINAQIQLALHNPSGSIKILSYGDYVNF